ncbi:tetratricopeptide repeat protein, partial [Phenylobacterium sp.]|uniref:tetratricopeptide repeat protein n=1 Tax=Phenylobacterium sp. TaxID=1871053 RepID=UPI0039833701
MNQRLAAAEAALQAGCGPEAIEHLIGAITEDPAQTMQVYRALVMQFYRAKRHGEGVAWSDKALARFPRDLDLWNLRGVMLRQLKRFPEALAAYDQALKIRPGYVPTLSNRGNVYVDMKDGVRAEAALQAGCGPEAIEHLIGAITEDP